jgi:hypothetical protein
MQVDENGDSFLHVVLRKCFYWYVDDFFTATFKFLIGNFAKSFVQNFLLIQNKRQENCLNLVCQKDEEKIPKILGLLSKDFQNDREFFTKLFNEELKKNKKVRKWIKKNLDFIDLPDEESQSKSKPNQEDSDSSWDLMGSRRTVDSDSSFTEKESKVENPNENSEIIVDRFEAKETSVDLELSACQSKCCKIC